MEFKTGTEVTLNISSDLIGNSNEETNFPHKLSLTNTQVLKICIVKLFQLAHQLI